MDDARRRRLEGILADYFDIRTVTLIDRVQALLSLDDLDDPEAADALFDEFVEVLERRYGRTDPGWAASTASFLRAEWDRQLEQTRAMFDVDE